MHLFRYKLYGEDASSLCFHNSRVAEDIKKYDIAHTWRIVGLICAFTSFFEKPSSGEASPSNHENTNSKFIAFNLFFPFSELQNIF